MIEIVVYKTAWKQEFNDLGMLLKNELDSNVKGIHHIGSTSVPGLAAKDVIDIQISVGNFSPQIIKKLAGLGFQRLEHITHDHRPAGMVKLADTELYKWFFQKTNRAVNLHVRKTGTFNQRYPLLCRDYLRHNLSAAKAYELVKINLAARFANDMDAYYDIKDPVFDVLMAGAEIWAAGIRWQPNDSDI